MDARKQFLKEKLHTDKMEYYKDYIKVSTEVVNRITNCTIIHTY